MPKTKVEVYDKNQLIYPFIESDHVTFSNGMKVSEMLDQSISMPKVIHEDLNFKVGVGDQDVSSAIVDSSVSEMTIKGKTYQNILPEPSTHVLTNNKEMFEVNEGLDPNVEIVDGVSKSAILKGQTLVNGLSNPVKSQGKNYVTIVSPTHLIINHGENVSEEKIKVEYEWLGGKMGDGVDYTLDIWILKNTMRRKTDPNASIGKINFNSYNNGFYSIPSNTLGHITYEVTTSKTNTGGKPYIETFTTCEGELEIQIVVRQGRNLEPIEKHFEGMQSVKAPVLKTTGKNLFDFEKTQVGYLGANPHVLNAPDLNNKTSDYIRVKPNTTYTYSFDGFTASQVGNEYWTGWYYYTSPTEVSKKNMNRQVVRGSADTFKTVTFTTPSDCYYVRIGSRGLALSGAVAQLEESLTATTHEPYKTNILSAPEEVVLRSLPSGICDTLNLNTGEYVQHIKEVVFDGSSDESIGMVNVNDTTLVRFNINNVTGVQTGNTNKVLCSSLPYLYIHGLSGGSATVSQECISNHSQDANTINIVIKRSRLSSVDVAGFRAYLQSNPITIQYQLATPVVKTVDLSSFGNWEKVVLDGSENWTRSMTNNNYFMETNTSILPNRVPNVENYFIHDSSLETTKIYTSNTNIGICIPSNGGIRIRTIEVQKGQTLEEFKQCLQQNPITVWYQTTTTLDSTQVKQPIFFKDGHIQLSSGVDNSLIPTLDYQAKTSNSYVMDLMKTNTKYTMKAKTASGTFTIDGTSYGAGINGTFTTPTSMTNKLLVMSNKTNEEVMILEGDVTSKIIPYFKGIKSAFEGEDKIEVLSTRKNLFDMNRHYDNITNAQATVVQNVDEITISSVENGTYVNVNFVLDKNFFKGKTVTGSCLYESDEKGIGTVQINYQDTTGKKYYQSIKTSKTFTFPDEFVGEVLLCVYANNTNTPQPNTVTVKNIQLELGTRSTTYDSHKSNVSKIPLLSPLRSLPNGVCDELIIDRMKNKATLIQKVGKVVLDGGEAWNYSETIHVNNVRYWHNASSTDSPFKGQVVPNGVVLCSHFPNIDYGILGSQDVIGVGLKNNNSATDFGLNFPLRLLSSRNDIALKKWLSQNPITVYYELKTPIITEVDLEGFPYIYKDGHIFLNSEIVPTTEIIYSINQCQQISASNEDIIRHEKELTYLQKLIAQYVQVDYESALLSLKV